MQATLFEDDAQVANGNGSTIALRDYQQAAHDAIIASFASNQKVLTVMPTGTGKTVLFAHLIRTIQTGRAIVLAHREELIYQAKRTIETITGENVAIEMADRWSDEYSKKKSRIIVSTIQSQVAGKNEKRHQRFRPDDFALTIVDEAHHAVSKTYRAVIEHYASNENNRILGVTATPDRTDEKALGQVFTECAYDYEISDAIHDGWLVPIHARPVTVVGLDYSKVRKVAGDLCEKDLDAIFREEEMLHKIASPIHDLCGVKKTLIFAVNVGHAEALCGVLNRYKPGMAEWVCGKTPADERSRIFKRYHQNEYQYLVNVDVATEGFDEPGIEVVVCARPTLSRSKYAQMVGRGTRPLKHTVDGFQTAELRRMAIESSEKPHVEVIDFVGNSDRHKLATATDILGGKYDDEVIERAKKQIDKKAGKPSDIAEELEEAKQFIENEKAKKKAEQERRRNIIANAEYVVRDVDPFNLMRITRPRSGRGWDCPPSEKQIALLAKMKVPTEGVITKKQASVLIGEIFSRREKKLCTYGQMKTLKKYGVDQHFDLQTMSFSDASAHIDRIAKNGWRSWL